MGTTVMHSNKVPVWRAQFASKNFSCRAITTSEQQMKQASDMGGVTHWEVVAATTLLPVLLRLGPNILLWIMDLPVHLGEMRLFLIVCVTRWRSLAVQQLEGNTNIFRDRLTSWGKRWKKLWWSNTCLQLPLHDERPFGRSLGRVF